MPHFLAVYTMHPDSLARFLAMPKAEQDAIDAAGVPLWHAWEAEHAEALGDRHMVGKTLRVSRAGTAPATNDISGYVIVEADSIEAAAKHFENHPHFAVFPGDAIDIMPFVT